MFRCEARWRIKNEILNKSIGLDVQCKYLFYQFSPQCLICLFIKCCFFFTVVFLLCFYSHSNILIVSCFLFYYKIDCQFETLKKKICLKMKKNYSNILCKIFCFICKHNVIFFSTKDVWYHQVLKDMLIESITTVFPFHRFRQCYLTYQ